MRRSRGVPLPPLRTGRVRRRDLYVALRDAVLEGVLARGERLPSSRQAALDYGVSRGLIEEVFGQLTEEGFLERAVGRGTFVATGTAGLKAPRFRPRTGRPAPTPSRRGLSFVANALCREPPSPMPFNAGVAETTDFPWRIWMRLQARAAREGPVAAMNGADPRGVAALRAAVAHHLAQFRGIRCRPEQVIIFGSSQQALCSLAVLLLDRGDTVWIEDPCYPGARAAFELAGAAMAYVPVNGAGMQVATGVRRFPRARLVYVTPGHQYPTGVALALERRIELLEWAARKRAWVVEDDYDGEFRYGCQPLTPLYALDPGARVIYVGTLSKTTFVSLRLAYTVVPEEIVEPLASLRTQIDGFTPALPQMTMALFMEEGYYSAHLRRMRAIYGAKRADLVSGLGPLAARGWTWPENPAGLHLLVSHPSSALVRATRAASTLDLALLSAYRIRKAPGDGLFLRFGGLQAAEMRAGVEALLVAARDAAR